MNNKCPTVIKLTSRVASDDGSEHRRRAPPPNVAALRSNLADGRTHRRTDLSLLCFLLIHGSPRNHDLEDSFLQLKHLRQTGKFGILQHFLKKTSKPKSDIVKHQVLPFFRFSPFTDLRHANVLNLESLGRSCLSLCCQN